MIIWMDGSWVKAHCVVIRDADCQEKTSKQASNHADDVLDHCLLVVL